MTNWCKVANVRAIVDSKAFASGLYASSAGAVRPSINQIEYFQGDHVHAVLVRTKHTLKCIYPLYTGPLLTPRYIASCHFLFPALLTEPTATRRDRPVPTTAAGCNAQLAFFNILPYTSHLHFYAPYLHPIYPDQFTSIRKDS